MKSEYLSGAARVCQLTVSSTSRIWWRPAAGDLKRCAGFFKEKLPGHTVDERKGPKGEPITIGFAMAWLNMDSDVHPVLASGVDTTFTKRLCSVPSTVRCVKPA